MGILKGIGYVISAILVFCFIVSGVLLVYTLMTFGGIIAFVIGAIVVIALLIKEYTENASTSKDPE